MQARELEPHLHAELGVEVGERLVEEEDLGLAHDRAADRDALALAAGELRRLLLQVVLEPQDARGLADLVLDLGLRPPREAQAEGHVLEDGQVRIERVGLEDHRDAALGRLLLGDVARPRSRSVPAVVSSSPAIMRSSVDLPQPDGPTKTANSPRSISMRDAVDDLGGAEGLLDAR